METILFLFDRVQGPHWENISRGLSGTRRVKRVLYNKN